MINRAQVVKRLRANQAEIQAHGVKSLALFGSVARDESHPGSDIDLLVEFSHPVGIFTLIELKQYLEELLGGPVDLGTLNSLKPYLKDKIIKEAIHVV